MTKLAAPLAVWVIALALPLLNCTPSAEDGSSGSAGKGGSSSSGGSSGRGGSGGGAGGSTGTGGASSSGGSTGAGGSSASGGSPGGGTGGRAGSLGSGGSSARGGSSGAGGSSATDTAAGGANDGPAAYFKSTCDYPVMSGYSPIEFCTTYAEICTFVGAGRYKDMAECMTRFKGGSSDADACKAGHLCRAFKLPAGKEKDCASAGTSA